MWREVLTRLSRFWLRDSDIVADLPPEVRVSGWLGYAGATEAQLTAVEERLGTTLPPSYRSFLSVSNGWRITSSFVDRLWSTEELE
jgi:hypothetical protein